MKTGQIISCLILLLALIPTAGHSQREHGYPLGFKADISAGIRSDLAVKSAAPVLEFTPRLQFLKREEEAPRRLLEFIGPLQFVTGEFNLAGNGNLQPYDVAGSDLEFSSALLAGAGLCMTFAYPEKLHPFFGLGAGLAWIHGGNVDITGIGRFSTMNETAPLGFAEGGIELRGGAHIFFHLKARIYSLYFGDVDVVGPAQERLVLPEGLQWSGTVLFGFGYRY